jgi:hypothetical protein
VVAIALLVACGDRQPPATAPVAAEPPRPDAGPPVRMQPDAWLGSFAEVTGPMDGITVGMPEEDVPGVLTAAGLTFEKHAGKRPHWYVTERDGWKMVLYLDEGFDFISYILSTSPEQASEEEARALVARIAAPYGPPQQVERTETNDGRSASTSHTWRNPTTTLEISIDESHLSDGVHWYVMESWARPDRDQ